LSWGNTGVYPLAFNYDRTESYNATIPVTTFEEQLNERQLTNWSVLVGDTERLAAGASTIEEGKKYWLSLIVWALIFLAVEVLLIKFWR